MGYHQTLEYLNDQGKPIFILTNPQDKAQLDKFFQERGIECTTKVNAIFGGHRGGRNNTLARSLAIGPTSLGECFDRAQSLVDNMESSRRRPRMFMRLWMNNMAGELSYKSECIVGKKECKIITPTAKIIVPAEINYRNRPLEKKYKPQFLKFFDKF